MENMDLWSKLKTPPPSTLKKIGGGRLKGMTDIKPQWRYQVMTEVFGPCGVGWKFTVEKKWTEIGSEDQIAAFADVNLYIWIERENSQSTWSEPIPGTGGSMFIAKEKTGPYTSDEAYKMAVTDALSTAMKMIGVAADVYMGDNEDRTKYDNAQKTPNCPSCKKNPPVFQDKKDPTRYFCWDKKGGCGHNWHVVAPGTTEQENAYVKFQAKIDSFKTAEELDVHCDKHWAAIKKMLSPADFKKASSYVDQIRKVLNTPEAK